MYRYIQQYQQDKETRHCLRYVKLPDKYSIYKFRATFSIYLFLFMLVLDYER